VSIESTEVDLPLAVAMFGCVEEKESADSFNLRLFALWTVIGCNPGGNGRGLRLSRRIRSSFIAQKGRFKALTLENGLESDIATVDTEGIEGNEGNGGRLRWCLLEDNKFRIASWNA